MVDCGTGRGERFLSLSDAYRLGIGMDPEPAMLAAAQANGVSSGAGHKRWVRGRGEELPLAERSMDVVLNRHASVAPEETLHVLRPGGSLIMQEVGARKLQASCSTFGCGTGEGIVTNEHRELLIARSPAPATGA